MGYIPAMGEQGENSHQFPRQKYIPLHHELFAPLFFEFWYARPTF